MQKIPALCIAYSIAFRDFLRASGLAPEETGAEPLPAEFIRRENSLRGSHTANREGTARKQNGFTNDLLKRWEEVPLFLRSSLSELTRVPNFSVSDVFWVGGDPSPIHPWLEDAESAGINRRVKKPASWRGQPYGNSRCTCLSPGMAATSAGVALWNEDSPSCILIRTGRSPRVNLRTAARRKSWERSPPF